LAGLAGLAGKEEPMARINSLNFPWQTGPTEDWPLIQPLSPHRPGAPPKSRHELCPLHSVPPPVGIVLLGHEWKMGDSARGPRPTWSPLRIIRPTFAQKMAGPPPNFRNQGLFFPRAPDRTCGGHPPSFVPLSAPPLPRRIPCLGPPKNGFLSSGMFGFDSTGRPPRPSLRGVLAPERHSRLQRPHFAPPCCECAQPVVASVLPPPFPPLFRRLWGGPRELLLAAVERQNNQLDGTAFVVFSILFRKTSGLFGDPNPKNDEPRGTFRRAGPGSQEHGADNSQPRPMGGPLGFFYEQLQTLGGRNRLSRWAPLLKTAKEKWACFLRRPLGPPPRRGPPPELAPKRTPVLREADYSTKPENDVFGKPSSIVPKIRPSPRNGLHPNLPPPVDERLTPRGGCLPPGPLHGLAPSTPRKRPFLSPPGPPTRRAPGSKNRRNPGLLHPPALNKKSNPFSLSS